ncbi:molybdopterin converting factor subunit 1 [Cohaesibacter gelatinilyticus]|mgnify:CR=1 FL=1|uniref:Molybdopterin synthase subunit MoaD n=1 Tax=Cohaesibacter gelatinilyticus TaxID=372072 RepID=A0A285PGK6_9HYPH|nr:molybdopterin converting factor subunit 1 [Cohaesibacter gelatinilyticus]SNZ20865.1 molybdopterin synthase subunit MoaD [Cohaesibacter gelatinilyticus]HAT87166.1 molybdopterin converting factor subunit 1 [Hyphomicrobiales bacterium]
MKLIYFAWIRERLGIEEEEIDLPNSVTTVQDLLLWQQGRDDQYEGAFADLDTIRVALDQFHAERDDPVAGASEIAFFPPMTGG